MEVYIVFTLILFVFSFYEVFFSGRMKKRILLFLSFIGAVFIIGLRWETGTDWGMYEVLYDKSDTWKDTLFLWQTEVGYGLLSWAVRSITENYSVFLVIHAMLFYGLLIRAFTKLTKYPQVAFFFYFASSLGIVGSNRQLIALVILLNGIAFLLDGGRKKFLMSIVGAFTFHSTSFLGAVYYFLNRYLSKMLIVVCLVGAFAFGLSPLPLKLFGAFGSLGEHFMKKTDAYIASAKTVASEYGLSITGVFKRIFFFLFFFFIRDKIVSKMPSYNLLFNGYFAGILMYLTFHSSLNVMISRGSLYFNVMEALLFSSFFVFQKKPIERFVFLWILLIMSILLMYQSIGEYPDIFDPYKGLWYNENFYRRAL